MIMTNPKLQVLEGDITRISADAIVTPINSFDCWYGGIDYAIQRVAGEFYHNQARKTMPLKNLQTIIARGLPEFKNKFLFKDVVFVVDDVVSSLNKVIYNGLEAASKENYQTILVPAMRLGEAKGIYEKTENEVIDNMSLGVREFLDKYSIATNLEKINFVIYNDPQLTTKITEGLSNLK